MIFDISDLIKIIKNVLFSNGIQVFVHNILEIFPISSSLIMNEGNFTKDENIILHFYSGIITIIPLSYFIIKNLSKTYILNSFILGMSFVLGYVIQHFSPLAQFSGIKFILYSLVTLLLIYVLSISREERPEQKKPTLLSHFLAGFLGSLFCSFNLSRTALFFIMLFINYRCVRKAFLHSISYSAIINIMSWVIFVDRLYVLYNLNFIKFSLISLPIVALIIYFVMKRVKVFLFFAIFLRILISIFL
jgi:hypothetical protein